MKSIKALEIRLKELKQCLIFAHEESLPKITAKIEIIEWMLERTIAD